MCSTVKIILVFALCILVNFNLFKNTVTGNQNRIFKGNLPRQGSHDFVVGLLSLTTGLTFCTGAIINPSLVLTAGHCVENKPAREIQVAAGVSDLLSVQSLRAGQLRTILRIQIHQNYNMSSYTCGNQNDLAKIVLSSPFQFQRGYVQAVDLQFIPHEPANGLQCTFYGFGGKGNSALSSGSLQSANYQILARQTCIVENRRFSGCPTYAVNDNQICTKWVANPPCTCLFWSALITKMEFNFNTIQLTKLAHVIQTIQAKMEAESNLSVRTKCLRRIFQVCSDLKKCCSARIHRFCDCIKPSCVSDFDDEYEDIEFFAD